MKQFNGLLRRQHNLVSTTHSQQIAPLTLLHVGCLGSFRRAILLWLRSRLAELVHMENSCRSGVRHLPACHGRAPIASSTFSASFRCFEGEHVRFDINDGPSVDIGVRPKHRGTKVLVGKQGESASGGFVAHGAPKKTAASWNPRPQDPSGASPYQAAGPSKALAIGSGPGERTRVLQEQPRRTSLALFVSQEIYSEMIPPEPRVQPVRTSKTGGV